MPNTPFKKQNKTKQNKHNAFSFFINFMNLIRNK